MVWYNITAYNIKVKFVLRNNKEKVICNNKNAEGVMQMKCSKNLERAIILGLVLSSVAVPVWADENADIYYHGPTDIHGNGYRGIIPVGNINGIDIIIDGVVNGYYQSTTEGITFSENTYNILGDVNIINTAMHENIDNNGALYAKSNATVTINGGDSEVYIAAIGGAEGRNGSSAISAKTPILEWGFDDVNTVTVSGNNAKIIGNLDNTYGLGTNTITLDLNTSNSYWYGDVASVNNDINISLSNGAEWIYDENSSLAKLELNRGVVNLNDSEIKEKYENTLINGYVLADYRSTDAHKSVTIENLTGTGGIFKVDIDWLGNKGVKEETDTSDYIYITNSDPGSTQTLDFEQSKANLDKMNVGDKLYFANVDDGDTSFTTVYGDNWTYNEAGKIYDYNYGVGSENNNSENNNTDWYIGLNSKSAESNPNFSAAKGAMYAGYALGTELDTLNKRMGEARYLEENDGVWVRYRHSKTGWDDTYETNGDMFQLGFDNEVTEKDGKHYRGVAIDYTDADTNIMGISGEGEHERYAVSLYDTWLGEKGHYRDLVLRGGRINSDYDVSGAFSNGYEDIGGDYHQWFGSISAEWGRKNDMGTGWYFEPQIQAQLARVGGASYVSDSGVDVDQDGATSLIGRAGFRIGREYVKDNGKHDNFYIKADLLHEFAGDKSFSLTGNDGRYEKEYDGQETWCDVGIGADISLGKNSYFWADVERTFGADFDNTWQINGGFRWEF